MSIDFDLKKNSLLNFILLLCKINLEYSRANYFLNHLCEHTGCVSCQMLLSASEPNVCDILP